MQEFFRKISDLFQKKIDETFVQNSKAFCIMPWVHLHVTQFGTVTPCCQAPWDEDKAYGNINKQSLDEIWTGERIRNFRKKMLKDEQDDRCVKCYSKEEVGVTSLRQVINNTYKNKIPWVQNTDRKGHSPEAKPVYWDIRFSNLCNFRCRICGPFSSSRWFDDAKALGQTKPGDVKVTHGVKNYPELLESLKPFVDTLEEIYFAGGEPLIMEEHYALLELLDHHKKYDIQLRYNTNFSVTTFKGTSVFDLWPKFEKVLLLASLDDSGKRGELQRKDQDWEQVISNIETLREKCPNVHFMLSPTLSALNAHHFPDFHREWVEKGYIDVKDCWPNQLEEPKEYNFKILPRKMREDISEKYNLHADWILSQSTTDEHLRGLVEKEFRNVANSMLSDDWEHLQPEFRKRCKEMDDLRGEKTIEVIPELREVLEIVD